MTVSRFLIATVMGLCMAALAVAENIPSRDASNYPDEDWDNDGLSNGDEIESGLLPGPVDSDADGVIDGNDGWPADGDLSPPRVAKSKYVVIRLGDLIKDLDYPVRVADDGAILYWDKQHRWALWRAGARTATFTVGTLQVLMSDNGNHFVELYGGNSFDSLPPFVDPGDLPVPGTEISDPKAVTNAGQVVGFGQDSSVGLGASYRTRFVQGAIWWEPSQPPVPLGALLVRTNGVSNNATFIEPQAVNNSGGVVGRWVQPEPADQGAAFYRGGNLIKLPGTESGALEINDTLSPWIVGYSENKGTFWAAVAGSWTKKFAYINPKVGQLIPGGLHKINDRYEMFSLDQNRVVRNGVAKSITELADLEKFEIIDVSRNGLVLGRAVDGQTDAYPSLLVPADLAVDANRDGVTKFVGNCHSTNPNLSGKPLDKTEKNKPFTFWINDDHDGSGTGSEKLEGSADCADNKIKSKRDLEDFARLNIYLGGMQNAVLQGEIKVGLKWKDTTNSPAIKVWQNRSPDGGDEYLKDDSIAGQHLLLANPGLVQGSFTYIIPTTFWQQQGFSATQPCGYMLFEGVSEGKGHLVITIHKSDGTEIGEGPGVWFDLKTIKDMYERATALPLALTAPFDRATNFNTTAASVMTFGTRFEKPWDETKEVIVFVHGWNTDEAAYDWTSATLFKRLWHRGFKGRFGAFRWDTLMGPGFESFHISEWRGYKFGKSLQDYVTNLKGRLPGYSINVASHSLGSAVLASALDRGASIDNCIFMQGSQSAHSFDPGAVLRTNALNPFAAGNFVTPDLYTDGGYRQWLSASAVNVVNFFNPGDQILTLLWTGFQNGKPHDPTGPGHYRYTSSTRRCWIEYSSGALPSRDVFDYHESMAFVAVSRTAAIGAQATGGAIDRNVDLGSGGLGLGNEHGPQFDRNIQNDTFSFYNEVLDSFYIPFNP